MTLFSTILGSSCWVESSIFCVHAKCLHIPASSLLQLLQPSDRKKMCSPPGCLPSPSPQKFLVCWKVAWQKERLHWRVRQLPREQPLSCIKGAGGVMPEEWSWLEGSFPHLIPHTLRLPVARQFVIARCSVINQALVHLSLLSLLSSNRLSISIFKPMFTV